MFCGPSSPESPTPRFGSRRRPDDRRRGCDLAIDVLSSDRRSSKRSPIPCTKSCTASPGLVEIQTSRKAGKPEISVAPRRNQLAEHGLERGRGREHAPRRVRGVKSGVYAKAARSTSIKSSTPQADRRESRLHRRHAAPVSHGNRDSAFGRRRSRRARGRVSDHAQGQAGA